MKNDIEGFLSNPFFAAIKTNDVNIPEKVPNRTEIDTDNIIKGFVLRNIHYTGFETVVIPKEELINAVKESILDTIAIEDLVSYFIVDEEESLKALNLIKRKQYNAKLVIAVLTNFLVWFDYIDEAKLALVLLINVRQKINSLKEKIVIDKCGEFKTLMDKVTGGISLDCYVSFVSKINKTYSLNEFITDYILTKHGYSLDKYLGNLFSYTNINEIILSLAVYNNLMFWNFDNNSFLIFFFLNLVLKYHGLAYVKKIVDFAFSQICQTKEGLFIYEHKLPLYFLSSSLENNILTLAINKIKRRLGQAINLNINLEEAQGLLYPVHYGFDQEIAKGKEVFINFIQKKAYPNDASFVLKLFSDTNSVIQDETKGNNILKKRKIALAEMLDYDILDYYDFDELKAYFTGLNPNFSTNDATLSRFYYRVYLISKYANDITNECIYEVYFDLLNMLNLKYNLLCHYQINNELREAKYKALKEVLAAFALKIDDSYKAIYIAALLDRKSATLNETMLYAELEQLGDAIYNLAVCNILFYNEETKLTNKTKEEYIKADAEVKVANYLCLNKLYISNLFAALNSKYLDHEEDID